jgi:2-polyprenyl-3-methyl-5-hydroxy-6-metoxy-1,4-benzoquinol methylase
MKANVKRSFYTTVDHPFEITSTEEVWCNYCGQKAFDLLGTELDFEIRSCTSCKSVYISPQMTTDELSYFYDNMYLDDSPEEIKARGLGYTEKQMRKIITSRKPDGGKFLDVGCGFGAVLAGMDNLNWELYGLETGKKAIEVARERVPSATIHEGLIEDAGFEEGSFDCITIIAVLEHVKDPNAVLETLMKWLAPGGLLIVQVPHVEPFIRLKKWISGIPIVFEAPRHLFDFSPRTLRNYFQKTGCRDIKLDIALPYACDSKFAEMLIWGIKVVSIALHKITFRKYILPFSGGLIAHGIKK